MKSHQYKTVAEFLEDAELIMTNSAKYNGESAALTEVARKILQVTKDALKEVRSSTESSTMVMSWVRCSDISSDIGPYSR